MAAVNRAQRRALRLLAGSSLGATEAMMLAHGFTSAMLDALVRDGLATAERRAMKAGRRRIEVTWLTITEDGAAGPVARPEPEWMMRCLSHGESLVPARPASTRFASPHTGPGTSDAWAGLSIWGPEGSRAVD